MKRFRSTIDTHSRMAKWGLLASLYFSQGLPFGFFTQSLPVLLRQRGVGLPQIGLSSLLAIPWALKFLWAPVVDRLFLPSLGRRRTWILPLQGLTALTLTVLAAWAWRAVDDVPPVSLLMVAVLLLNLLAATQDIATDGWAVEVLRPEERGVANGLQVAAYRVGMIVGGGVLLVFQAKLGYPLTFLSMAVLTLLATGPVLFAREAPAPVVLMPASETSAQLPTHFLFLPGAWRLLLLICAFKFGDAFATAMLRPFLVDRGFSLADIGWILGTVGFVCSLVGAMVGGAAVNVIGRKRGLLLFGALQALTLVGYILFATLQLPVEVMYLLSGIEHLASGMATAAAFTCMMDWSRPESGATDYTVQASAVVIATGGANALSGFSAKALGYVGHFGVGVALSFAALVLVFALFPRRAPFAGLTASDSSARPATP